MRRPLLLAVPLLLAGCGESAPVTRNVAQDNGASDSVSAAPTPVRVGDLGPNFAACAGAGTTRRIEAGQSLAVRAAPFDDSEQTGAVGAGARFFLCKASLDQKWFGIVYDEGGTLAARCGVSDPAPARRDYDGPCRSGWVAAPYVKLIAGEPPQLPGNAAEPAPEANKGG